MRSYLSQGCETKSSSSSKEICLPGDHFPSQHRPWESPKTKALQAPLEQEHLLLFDLLFDLQDLVKQRRRQGCPSDRKRPLKMNNFWWERCETTNHIWIMFESPKPCYHVWWCLMGSCQSWPEKCFEPCPFLLHVATIAALPRPKWLWLVPPPASWWTSVHRGEAAGVNRIPLKFGWNL